MATIKCIECGELFDSKLKSCPNCGCPADATVLCPECSTSYDASLQSCPECGCPNEQIATSAAPVITQTESAAPQAAPTPPTTTPRAATAQPSAHSSASGAIFFATESADEPATADASTLICRECGEPIPANAKLCPNCGCPVEIGKVCCLECGTFYDEKLVECPECGCPNETLDYNIIDAMRQQEEQELVKLAEEKRNIANFLRYSMNYENQQTSSVGSTLFSAFIRCANFKGRSRRSELWCYVLFNCIISFGLYLALFASFGKEYMYLTQKDGADYYHELLVSSLSDHLVITLIIILYSLILILPTISLVARRLHDTNRSSLWMLIAPATFIASWWLQVPAYLGLGILTIMLLLDSVPDNKYGRCHTN